MTVNSVVLDGFWILFATNSRRRLDTSDRPLPGLVFFLQIKNTTVWVVLQIVAVLRKCYNRL